MRATVLVAAVIACGLAAGARADVVTVIGSLNGTIDPYEGIGDVFVPAFNTTLGTLTGIQVSTTAFLSEVAFVSPTGTGALPATGTFNTVFTARVIGSPSSYTAPVQSVTVPLTPGNGSGAGQATGSTTVNATFSNNFPAFAAADGFPLDVRYTIYANPTGGIGFSSIDSHSIGVSGNVSVAYSYDPTGTAVSAVPEPASMTLLGVGVAGAAFARKSRKREAVPLAV